MPKCLDFITDAILYAYLRINQKIRTHADVSKFNFDFKASLLVCLINDES